MKINLTAWQKISIYVIADAAMNVSGRVFQIYCTWLYVQRLNNPEFLSYILLTSYICGLVLLPFCGVLADRWRKSAVLCLAALLTLLPSLFAVLLSVKLSLAMGSMGFTVSLVVAGIVFSAGSSLLLPLGTPLISEVARDEGEVHRGIRLKSSMFVINLLLGPTLAGLLIGVFGGKSALQLSAIAAVVGSTTALAYLLSSDQDSRRLQPPRRDRYFAQLYRGTYRVLKIKAERVIAVASLLANLVFVPFLFLLLPVKTLKLGYSMLDLGLVELSLGAGVVLASAILVPRMRSVFSEHVVACFGITCLGGAIYLVAFADHLVLLALCACAAGAGLTLFNVTVNAKRAVSIPYGFRATMESSLIFLCTVAAPVGFWLSKRALTRITPDQVIVYGSEIFAIGIIIVIFSRSLRQMLNNSSSDEPYYFKLHKELF